MTIPSGRELEGSPEHVVAGDIETKSIIYPDTVSTTNSFMRAYRGSTDVSDTVLSGSIAASENVLTLKQISGEIGGSTYVYVFRATCLGKALVFFFRRIVEKESLR